MNNHVFVEMEVNDWKPLMVGVIQLWKIEFKAKFKLNNFSVLILLLQLWSEYIYVEGCCFFFTVQEIKFNQIKLYNTVLLLKT